MINTNDFKTKTIFQPRQNPSVNGYWGIALDVGFSSVKTFSPNQVACFPSYARKLPRAFACGTGMPLPPTPEGLFKKGHGDYHQPDEAISLKRVEMALVIYIKGILEICRKVTL